MGTIVSKVHKKSRNYIICVYMYINKYHKTTTEHIICGADMSAPQIICSVVVL